jgi:ethanolamine utilization protein EutA (predicted chaperonin)
MIEKKLEKRIDEVRMISKGTKKHTAALYGRTITLKNSQYCENIPLRGSQ